MCTATVALSPIAVASPNSFVQSFFAEYNICIQHQEQQQFILFVFQLNFFSVHKNPTAILLEQDGTELNLRAISTSRTFQSVILGEVCLNPGHQHIGRKGPW